MAVTKLTPKDAKRLTEIGIIAKTNTEEEARKKLLAYLSERDISGIDNDPLVDLIEMAAVFKESEAQEEGVEEQEESAEETEEVVEEQEEEVVAPPKKTVAKKPAVEEETEEELLEEVAEEVKTKPSAKKTVAPAAKKSTPVSTAEGERFDARNVEEHLNYLGSFQELFADESFQIDLLKQGFTVRIVGKNAKTTIMNFDELRIVDEKLVGNLYLNRFKSVEELLEFLPEQYHEREIGMFRGESHPCIRKMKEEEVMEILKDSEVLSESLKRANATDVKLGVNREKLEESLEKGKKPPAKTTAVKKK